MNVKKIVVDKLPEGCITCDFCVQKVANPYPVCAGGLYEFITDTSKRLKNCPLVAENEKFNIAIYNDKMRVGRPSFCPLQVEEVCEWVKHVRHFPYSGVVYYLYATKCDYEFDDDKVMADWVFCPNCGKRIKYVESEE